MMFQAFALAALYIFGVWWCYEVVCRLRDDVREIFEQREIVRTIVIIFMWAITVVILILLIFSVFVIVREAGEWARFIR